MFELLEMVKVHWVECLMGCYFQSLTKLCRNCKHPENDYSRMDILSYGIIIKENGSLMFFKPKQLSEEQIQQFMQLFAEGKIKQLIDEATTLLRKFPKAQRLHNILSVGYYAARNYDDAATFAKQAIALQPDYTRAYVNLGNALAKLGNTDEAVAAYRQAVEIDTDFAEGYNTLGAFLLSTGETAEAIKNLTRSIEANPDYYRAHSNLGNALRDMDRLDEAEASYREAIRLKPDYAEAHNNLGAALGDLGRLIEAEAGYREAIRLRPDYAEAHSNLGNALRDMDRLEEAEASYREAIRLKPDYAEAHSNLATVLGDLGRLIEAEAGCREAIRLKPGYAEAHNNLGTVLGDLGRPIEAEACYREAIRLKPDYAEAHSNLGTALGDLGRLIEAEASCREAIRLRPDYAEAHYGLSLIKKFTENDTQISLIEYCYQGAETASQDRIFASFALAKAYEDTGRLDDAFQLYLEGNRLNKARLDYNIQQDIKLFDHIINSFVYPAQQPAGYLPQRPIFIIGMPRSGTSLVEQILASHSEVFGAGELPDMNSAVLTHSLKGGIGSGGHFSYAANVIKKIRQSYLAKLEALPATEPFIVDKMPHNFLWVGHILSAFPDARIIHLSRDPMAVCWSIFKLYFPRSELYFAYDLDALADYYKLYLRLMDFWRDQFPGNIYDLSYEALTENQEQETRRLLEYCGLEWQERCLDFHLNERAVSTASNVQVREKMYKGSSQAWRKFEKQLQPLVERLRDVA
ncbi:tetratricopeptide repeat protein [Mariprofundus erugo]|uniref:tetratricopeptide repeat-containing sulfotransferase family protein n=1 Tax=Mariprofundus erugo TaxID=2528639 RepID=UPI0010FDDE75|nr:tetratricopeptide repeat-containing sulfotransferase family protein [Mariprofundus erugo]TLS73510.1 tetratricopeptide repeat protein [Mariprofundus erugo]